MRIPIQEFDGFSWCQLPNGMTMYGKNTKEICDCLDYAAKMGMFGIDDSNEIVVAETKGVEVNR